MYIFVESKQINTTKGKWGHDLGVWEITVYTGVWRIA